MHVPDLASLARGYKFALTDIRVCEHDVVCLLAEAEHGYASMPPFISSRERENLKRKSKSKKNTSSRYSYCNIPFECSGVCSFISFSFKIKEIYISGASSPVQGNFGDVHAYFKKRSCEIQPQTLSEWLVCAACNVKI